MGSRGRSYLLAGTVDGVIDNGKVRIDEAAPAATRRVLRDGVARTMTSILMNVPIDVLLRQKSSVMHSVVRSRCSASLPGRPLSSRAGRSVKSVHTRFVYLTIRGRLDCTLARDASMPTLYGLV